MYIDSFPCAHHYNTLPSLEEAALALKKSPHFDEFIEKAKEIITFYRLETYMGVRLIHKHFPVEKDYVAVEEFQNINGISSLVTYPCSWEEIRKNKILPSSWMFSTDGNIRVFEMSRDPAIQSCTRLVRDNLKFFDEMRQMLQKYKLHNLLSISILQRDSLVASEKQIYLERKSPFDYRNIVQLKDRKNPKARNAVNTAWSFQEVKEETIRVHAGCAPAAIREGKLSY